MSMHRLEGILRKRSTLVVKVGTNLLTDKQKGIRRERIIQLARDVAYVQGLGHDVAIVSSGAIGAGVAALGLKSRPRTIPEKQATAAIGQPILMEEYQSAFRKLDKTVAQILLTNDDFTNRIRYMNARNTMRALFDKGVVPIINENDTVAVDEIKLGDNDNLSALVASLLGSDLLVILSDVDGLYTDDPTRNSSAELIPVVDGISPEIEKLARKSGSDLGTGGMITKIQAAHRCAESGIAMIITSGEDPSVLRQILSGDFRGTLFLPRGDRLPVRKKWIGFVAKTRGSVSVDDGARIALVVRHTSLLPSGVTSVAGEFRANDTVSVRDATGHEIARGVTNYSSADLEKIRGRRSSEIQKILGRVSRDEVIHKDNLVIITGRG
jgi:glutamate 5-kinase